MGTAEGFVPSTPSVYFHETEAGDEKKVDASLENSEQTPCNGHRIYDSPLAAQFFSDQDCSYDGDARLVFLLLFWCFACSWPTTVCIAVHMAKMAATEPTAQTVESLQISSHGINGSSFGEGGFCRLAQSIVAVHKPQETKNGRRA